MPVGQTIAVIGEEGEEVSVQPESTNGDSGQEEGSRAPVRRRRARAGPEGIGGRARALDVRADHRGPRAVAADGRIKASPLARRIAREKGLDLSQVPGLGRKDGSSPRTSSGRRRANPCRSPCRAGRAGSRGADVDPEDDRAPADQGVSTPVFQLVVSADMTRAGAARAAGRANPRRGDEADHLRSAHQALCGGAAAPPEGQLALRGRNRHALLDRERRNCGRHRPRPHRAGDPRRRRAQHRRDRRGPVGSRHPCPRRQAAAGRPRRRHLHDLQSRHVRDRPVHRRPQPASGGDPASSA